MSDMIELGARAAQDVAGSMGAHLDDYVAKEVARAVIEAMRWPTKPMFEGWRSVNCIKDQPDFEEFTYFNGDYGGWLACHQAMIDAALGGAQ